MNFFRLLMWTFALSASTAAAQSSSEILVTESSPNQIHIWGEGCTKPVEDPEGVSLVQLIANPERYEGKAVELIGYYHSGGSPFHRYSALFLHQEDYEQRNTSNSVWISRPLASDIKDGYVIVSGIFSQRVTGDLGFWNSGICNVALFKLWVPAKSLYGRE